VTSTFTTTQLAGERFIVRGTDAFGVIGETVLDGSQYLGLKGDTAHDAAHEAFNKAIEEFYAPITKAAEALEAAHSAENDIFVEVVQPAVAPTAGQDEIRIRLTPDTVILRLIDAGETDRLVWVGQNLEITAEPVAASGTPASK